MKIALLTNGIYPFSIGGIQKHSYFLAKYFAKNGVFVDVFYSLMTRDLDVNLSKYFSESELKYITFIEVGFPKTKRFPGHYVFASYLFSKKLFHLIKTETYQSIYAQGFTSWYFLKKQLNVSQIITNLHGLEMFQKSINLKSKFDQKVLQIPAKTIIQKSVKQVSLGGKLTNLLIEQKAVKKSIFTVPNGIDQSWILDKESALNNSKRFVFVGRYERRKGVEELNEVLSEIINDYDFCFDFVGPIPNQSKLNHPNIIYHGAVQDATVIKRILTKADALICPSHSEGMPTVILEAMSRGCAIIATDVGAVSTMVDDSNGWLIQTDFLVDNLKNAFQEVLNIDAIQFAKKKNNSISKVASSFTWDIVVNKTIEVICK